MPTEQKMVWSPLLSGCLFPVSSWLPSSSPLPPLTRTFAAVFAQMFRNIFNSVCKCRFRVMITNFLTKTHSHLWPQPKVVAEISFGICFMNTWLRKLIGFKHVCLSYYFKQNILILAYISNIFKIYNHNVTIVCTL